MEVDIDYMEMIFIRGEMIMKKEERQVPYYGGDPGYGYHHGYHGYGHGYYDHRESE